MDELSKLLVKLRGRDSLRDVADRSNKRISHSYLNILEKGRDPRSGKPIKPTPEALRIVSELYSYSYEELMILAGYLDRPPSNNNDPIEETVEQAAANMFAEYGNQPSIQLKELIREVVQEELKK